MGPDITVQRKDSSDEDVVVAVMGPTGSGKSTFINLISDSNLLVGSGLRSATNTIELSKPFVLDQRRITLIDTPGFDDTTRSDASIFKMIAAFLAETYVEGKKLAGVIYIHRISDYRMSGASRRNFVMFKKMCGDSTMKNVVLVTNMWGTVDQKVGETREAELANDDIFFKPALENGAKLLRHDNKVETAEDILRSILRNHPLPLQIQRELVDQRLDIDQTAAGGAVAQDMKDEIIRLKTEITELREEMKNILKIKDDEMKQILEAEMAKLHAQMIQMQSESEKLQTGYKEEIGRLSKLLQNLSLERKPVPRPQRPLTRAIPKEPISTQPPEKPIPTISEKAPAPPLKPDPAPRKEPLAQPVNSWNCCIQ